MNTASASVEGKGMSIVNVYWFCLLALEYVALFCQSYLQTSWNSWIIALWIIAMIGNVFAAVYCIRTFLNNMISYENLYFPKQEQRLSGLVGNILLLSKLENQNIPMKKTEYRLPEIMLDSKSLKPKILER